MSYVREITETHIVRLDQMTQPQDGNVFETDRELGDPSLDRAATMEYARFGVICRVEQRLKPKHIEMAVTHARARLARFVVASVWFPNDAILSLEYFGHYDSITEYGDTDPKPEKKTTNSIAWRRNGRVIEHHLRAESPSEMRASRCASEHVAVMPRVEVQRG